MIRRVNRLLLLVAIVASVLYLAAKNRGPAHVYLTESHQYDVTVGLTLIVSFIVGILVTTTVASYYAFRGYLRERALRQREKMQQLIREKMIEARGAAAAGNHDVARVLWEQILKRDPSNPFGRLEIARALERKGDLNAALASLDIARRNHPENIELLLYAAELHAQGQNRTSAIDHLELVLKKVRSKKTALRAAELAEELGRYEQALDFYKQYEQLGGYAPEIHGRLEYKRLVNSLKEKPENLYRELHDFTKRFSQSAEALVHLGDLEVGHGRNDAAAQLFIRAAKITGQLADWKRAVDLWVQAEKPERALAVLKAARAETKGEGRLKAELMTLRFQLELALLVEALKTLEGFPELAAAQTLSPGKEIWSEFYGLRAWYYALVGNFASSAESLRSLNNLALGLAQSFGVVTSPAVSPEPAPHLSTP